MKYCKFIIALILAATGQAAAQNITVTPAVGQYVDTFVRTYFLGEGVQVFNVKFNNTPGTIATPQIGTFQSNGFPGAQMDEGILLTTGHVSVAEGPNDHGYAAQGISNYYSDPLISVVSSGNVRSCATLDFDLVCLSNHLSFSYCFGSEEYPEFVGSTYNDVFAFFLTGIDPATGLSTTRNIALVPGSVSDEHPDGIAVAINSVNSGVPGSMGYSHVNIHPEFSGFYVENPSGTDGVQYNGYTMKLTAEATLLPCEVYHMHISICNIGDNNRDSGVMIEGNSLSSPSVTTGLSSDQVVSFGRHAGYDVPLSLRTTGYSWGKTHLSFGGELCNGIDFTCTTDSGDIVDASRDYIYIDNGVHHFTLRGIDTAVLDLPRTIEVYMATELCPQYPEMKVYDTLYFTMEEDPEEPDPVVIDAVPSAPLTVYPNPASGSVTVAAEGLRQVELMDVEGRVVLRSATPLESATFDLRGIVSGVYTLRAATTRGIQSTQVIVK